jgi:hypothetical protein
VGISGCTACQVGGLEALQAYDRAYEAKLNDQAAQVEKLNEATQLRNIYENQPVVGATVGSIINISA